MSEHPSAAAAKWTLSRTIMVVTPGVLAGFAWLLTCGIYVIGTARSSGDSENINAFVLILLPYPLIAALVLTGAALLAVAASARSRTTKIITLVLGALLVIAGCAAVSMGSVITTGR